MSKIDKQNECTQLLKKLTKDRLVANFCTLYPYNAPHLSQVLAQKASKSGMPYIRALIEDINQYYEKKIK